MQRVVEFWQASVLTRRRLIVLCWALHVERLMRALIVVAIDEVIELALLLEEVGTSRNFRRRSFSIFHSIRHEQSFMTPDY